MMILQTNKLYHISSDEVIMMSLTGGTVGTVREDGWHIFKGLVAPMSKVKKLTELEALQTIVDRYKKVCDDNNYDYEINSINDINTHNEVDHMMEVINENKYRNFV